MKRILALFIFLTIISCARKAEVRAPEFVRAEHYSYVKDEDGRVYIVTTTTKHFDEAMKTLHPGPSAVNKLDLYVITPLAPTKTPAR